MNAHYVGIDLGTTVLKAAVFTKDGVCLGEASATLPIESDAHGKREQAVDSFPATLRTVIRKTLLKQKVSPKSVIGIGIAAQGGSFVCVDKNSGKPFGPMVQWNDRVGHDRLAEINARKPASFWHPMSYGGGAVMNLAKLTVRREKHPAWFGEEIMCAGAGAFLFHMLTGDWRQEAGHAIQIGCYNWKKDALDLRGFAATGLDIDVPPMRPGNESAPLSDAMAKALGMKSGIPVVGPYMDHEAGYAAVHAISKKPMQVSLGTAWVANAVLPADADRTQPVQLLMPSPCAAGRLCVLPIQAGNQTWNWALETFLGGASKKHIAKANALLDAQVFPAGGLVTLPYIYSANPIDPSQLGGVSFVGAGFGTTKEDFLRAVVAGLCCEFRCSMEAAYPTGTCDSMILCGGTSRCGAIQQWLAALFPEMQVFINPDSDLAGPLGAVQPFGVKGTHALPKVPHPKKSFVTQAQASYGRFLAARKRLA